MTTSDRQHFRTGPASAPGPGPASPASDESRCVRTCDPPGLGTCAATAIPSLASGRRGDDDVAEVPRAVPVLARDEHQPAPDVLAEEPRGVVGDPSLGVDPHAVHDVLHGPAVGTDHHLVAGAQLLE